VPHPGDKIHIPLPFKDAVRGLLKVKPTKDMPGQERRIKRRSEAKRRVANPIHLRNPPCSAVAVHFGSHCSAFHPQAFRVT
jgi:hypothetical protein